MLTNIHKMVIQNSNFVHQNLKKNYENSKMFIKIKKKIIRNSIFFFKIQKKSVEIKEIFIF